MPIVRLKSGLCLLAAFVAFAESAPAATLEPSSTPVRSVASVGEIVIDRDGIPHLFAASEPDVAFLQGYVHAKDRLFQMDVFRRQADGTLAELLGSSALASDVQLRTFGLRRAAERSVPLLSVAARDALEAYAAGVNAYVAANPLPPEYAALELTRFRAWSPADSVSVLKLIAFQLSFDLSDLQSTMTLQAYVAAGARQGFDGVALFLEDTNRSAPFDPAATIPDAMRATPPRSAPFTLLEMDAGHPSNATLRLGSAFLDKLHRAPYAEDAIKSSDSDRGSNEFLVSGRLSRSGEPLIASDPHLPLSAPATFYEVHLQAPSAGIDAIGSSFAGVPYVILGNNQRIAWSATTHSADVTDVYQEKLVSDEGSPSGFSTIYRGEREHVIPLPQTFRANTLNDRVPDNIANVPAGGAIPPAVLIVPRRNQGPIIQLDAAAGTALSVQYAGASGTRELDAFRGFTRARNMKDFTTALEAFDVGSQNFGYADMDGNIALFVSGEIPLREDLQAGTVFGASPRFIRNGQGGHEWVSEKTSDPTRALPYEILPTSEMPSVVNPPRGFIVNANNDPIGANLDNDPFNQKRPGGGILYFGATFDLGVRAGRIDDLLQDKVSKQGRLSTSDLKAIQGDTVMKEARFFGGFILRAFENAQVPAAPAALRELAADPRVEEAVARLTDWDQSTPTGIPQGYDANDAPTRLRTPSAEEINSSVAATIYSVWRNRFLGNVIEATLKRLGVPLFNVPRTVSAAQNLLDRFDERRGLGASGVDFFPVDGVTNAAVRRDIVILRSLRTALELLSGDAYAAAFKRSTNQNDYRWGLLHRVMFDHPLGGQFSIPPAGGAFPPPLGADLPGIPVDGGLFTPDVSNNVLLQDTPASFVFRTGPTRRYVARARLFGRGFDAENALPGGQSALMTSPFYLNLLSEYLTNDTHPLRQTPAELLGNVVSVETLRPVR